MLNRSPFDRQYHSLCLVSFCLLTCQCSSVFCIQEPELCCLKSCLHMFCLLIIVLEALWRVENSVSCMHAEKWKTSARLCLQSEWKDSDPAVWLLHRTLIKLVFCELSARGSCKFLYEILLLHFNFSARHPVVKASRQERLLVWIMVNQ